MREGQPGAWAVCGDDISRDGGHRETRSRVLEADSCSQAVGVGRGRFWPSWPQSWTEETRGEEHIDNGNLFNKRRDFP